MGQIINTFLRDPLLGGSGQQQPFWVPAADLEETDDAYVLELDLPGVDKKDVNIELRDNEVRITGEVKEKERTGLLRRKARTVGRFRYEVALPDQVSADGIDASLSDGVLQVRVPKAQNEQRRRIDVKGA
jgi:HSP20 family protein